MCVCVCVCARVCVRECVRGRTSINVVWHTYRKSVLDISDRAIVDVSEESIDAAVALLYLGDCQFLTCVII